MENIIKKAIEGGAFGDAERIAKFNWHLGTGNDSDLLFFDNGESGVKISLHKQFMIADFWQALGKSCGWGIEIDGFKGDVHVNHHINNGKCTEMCVVPSKQIALRFHEENLTNGWNSAVNFLESMVNSPNE